MALRFFDCFVCGAGHPCPKPLIERIGTRRPLCSTRFRNWPFLIGIYCAQRSARLWMVLNFVYLKFTVNRALLFVYCQARSMFSSNTKRQQIVIIIGEQVVRNILLNMTWSYKKSNIRERDRWKLSLQTKKKRVNNDDSRAAISRAGLWKESKSGRREIKRLKKVRVGVNPWRWKMCLSWKAIFFSLKRKQ